MLSLAFTPLLLMVIGATLYVGLFLTAERRARRPRWRRNRPATQLARFDSDSESDGHARVPMWVLFAPSAFVWLALTATVALLFLGAASVHAAGLGHGADRSILRFLLLLTLLALAIVVARKTRALSWHGRAHRIHSRDDESQEEGL